MAELSAMIVAQVVSTCQQGSTEVGAAFGRALDAELTIAVGPSTTLNSRDLPPGIDGPGLAVVLTVGEGGVLILLPESTRLLPSWCPKPGATGESKLATLAQELGMLLLPEEFFPDNFEASWVGNLARGMIAGGVNDGSPVVPLELTRADGFHGTAFLVWPAANPGAVLTKTETPTTTPAPKSSSVPEPPKPSFSRIQPSLPIYARSLLRIQVPVVVTLARNRQPLGRIVELGPGSIIHFNKSCDSTLDLEIGDQAIATGEAVKVGDKFGLRITSIILPEERFKPIAIKTCGKR